MPVGYCVPTRPDIFEFVGFRPTDKCLDVSVGPGQHFTQRISAALKSLGIEPRSQWDRFHGNYSSDGPIVLCPKTGHSYKDWPSSRWGQLLHQLQSADVWCQLQTDGSLWELEAQLQGASLVVGGDTGPLHLADYMRIPVLGLFGVTDPKVHGPLGEYAQVINRPNALNALTVNEVYSAVLKQRKFIKVGRS